MLRAYSVLIDGEKVDAFDAGATRCYALPPGAHEIGVAMDFYKGLPCTLTLREGETVRLECGEKAPLGGEGGFSLRGLGNALGSMLSPNDYFYLRAVGSDAGALPSADAGPLQSPAAKLNACAEPMIFLSYRREDSEHITGRIRDRLGAHFGEHAIFRDVDSIPAGMDFVRKVEDTINAVIIPPEPYFAEGVKRLTASIEALIAPQPPAAALVPPRRQFCVACGNRLAADQTFCTRCGQRV